MKEFIRLLELEIENFGNENGAHEPDTNAFNFDNESVMMYDEGLGRALEIAKSMHLDNLQERKSVRTANNEIRGASELLNSFIENYNQAMESRISYDDLDPPDYMDFEIVSILQKIAATTIILNDDDPRLEGFIRAFWRRIEPYKDDYGRELPRTIPVEFKAHMITALMVFEG